MDAARLHTPFTTILKSLPPTCSPESGGASATAIQAMLRKLIDAENPRSPLSDARLAEMLKGDGIPVARRTVAKYREAMNIASSNERQRL